MPFEKKDVKLIVYQHLKNSDQTVSVYKDNTPSEDWISHFIKRHEVLSNRMCQNIKGTRAGINPEEVKKYFENLKTSLEGVPIGKILNYDETNLANDPGMKKFIFRRGMKYPERVINFSKISVMLSGIAEREMLPPYLVYKATNLWES
ncbi:hypothetical protein PoB_002001100 [Plakobranchus ocellatus]|uniref:HTH CENPB-type domain-containing protein n=1 Tax=Plakobranchus ocellatus TaxID=259542 RepID=A0AAV3ZFV3_9GAST|nr:hypothetical protein PoB_002001100 [Plakobranchus ocellatus]